MYKKVITINVELNPVNQLYNKKLIVSNKKFHKTLIVNMLLVTYGIFC